MHFSPLLVLSTAALATAQEYNAPASIAPVRTTTHTRTVQRVATVTSVRYPVATGNSSLAAFVAINTTAVATGEVLPSALASAGLTGPTGSASRCFANVGVVIVAGFGFAFALVG